MHYIYADLHTYVHGYLNIHVYIYIYIYVLYMYAIDPTACSVESTLAV